VVAGFVVATFAATDFACARALFRFGAGAAASGTVGVEERAGTAVGAGSAAAGATGAADDAGATEEAFGSEGEVDEVVEELDASACDAGPEGAAVESGARTTSSPLPTAGSSAQARVLPKTATSAIARTESFIPNCLPKGTFGLTAFRIGHGS